MFERFTDRARRVLVVAKEEARALDHTEIGSVHILLGLLDDQDSIAAQIMKEAGITAETIKVTAASAGFSQGGTSDHIPFTLDAKRVLEASMREALQLGDNFIGTEHMLLGVLHQEEPTVQEVLSLARTSPRELREDLLKKRLSEQFADEGDAKTLHQEIKYSEAGPSFGPGEPAVGQGNAQHARSASVHPVPPRRFMGGVRVESSSFVAPDSPLERKTQKDIVKAQFEIASKLAPLGVSVARKALEEAGIEVFFFKVVEPSTLVDITEEHQGTALVISAAMVEGQRIAHAEFVEINNFKP